MSCSSSHKLSRIWQFTNFQTVLMSLNFRSSSHICRKVLVSKSNSIFGICGNYSIVLNDFRIEEPY
ncbi:hypothetical protein E4413_03575 [Leptospira interrogans]|uniref:Uncharacterized protein n=1 Tax=Leptospira interrogans serovar Canicola TaxID=211880 RepID=A0AAP9WEC2_LEPIR|nr:hypothetical protein A6J42_08200 [Leptospira interrogans serovar Copenhageni]ASP42739.1 hypothetical protein AMR47_18215 [Leptospira interrogans]QOI35491.1 hypothetical protein LeptoLang_15535 [Leptospira interrogans serovar Icterohaemorrhagiae]QOI39572.1 hypothetical protein Lepto1548_15750 [Leptospira interrogans serovar Bataviae]QOI43799.1 hypothetical protein Lepto782_17115 [Leptospira interrogans serovar Canicola]